MNNIAFLYRSHSKSLIGMYGVCVCTRESKNNESFKTKIEFIDLIPLCLAPCNTHNTNLHNFDIIVPQVYLKFVGDVTMIVHLCIIIWYNMCMQACGRSLSTKCRYRGTVKIDFWLKDMMMNTELVVANQTLQLTSNRNYVRLYNILAYTFHLLCCFWVSFYFPPNKSLIMKSRNIVSKTCT